MPRPLAAVLDALERIAPLELAEDWDNTGLIVESPDVREIERCTLTIDLTESVLDEVLANRSQLVVAYHPPWFRPLKRLGNDLAHERVLLRAIRAGLSIYSPHTALDAAHDGVNDWLCTAFTDAEREPIPSPTPNGIAIGRSVRLRSPMRLSECAETIKRHLGLDRVRVAASDDHASGETIRTIALCAGSGGSIIGEQPADLYWTGEMRHHDVLAALARGTSVILCDHTNTERGYLPRLRERLDRACEGVEFVIASADAEPLRIV
ncbi:MAG: Nif3-like dinuclear metal center hexameric protein [Planctomycetes bacterium]|nr:Nif3-like dinuclear metal center hexameric protein [Planctomycetota bacterium]